KGEIRADKIQQNKRIGDMLDGEYRVLMQEVGYFDKAYGQILTRRGKRILRVTCN
ncbi:hypothetical protein EZS27_037491, partial [termite gut metagenome]